MGIREISMVLQQDTFYAKTNSKEGFRIWIAALNLLNGKNEKEKGISITWFEKWYKDNTVATHKALPSFVTTNMGVGLTKNSMIFQGRQISPIHMCHQIRYAFEGSWKPENPKPPKLLKEPESNKKQVLGFLRWCISKNPRYLWSLRHFIYI